MNINLNLYKYFFEVAKYGSYTKAANAISISQPSLSYSVKVLENQLDMQLFKKVNNKIELTEEGKKLYDKLENVFDILSTIENDKNSEHKILRLGVRNAYANRILPHYINKLSEIHPNLLIEVFVGNSKTLQNSLKHLDIDIVIDECSYGDDFVSLRTNNSFHPIFFTNFKKNNELKNVVLDYNYLKEQEIQVVAKNQLYRDLEKMYKNFNYIKRQSTSIMINEVRLNNKIGISQKELIKDELDNEVLFELSTDLELPSSYAYINYLKNNKNNSIDDLIDFFNEYAFNQES